MKRLALILLGVCLLLAGCQSQSAPQAEIPNPSSATVEPIPEPASEPAPESTPEPITELVPESITKPSTEPANDVALNAFIYSETQIPMNQVDFASYEDELSEEEWQALSAFFPLLLEGKNIMVSYLPGEGPQPPPKERRLDDLLFNEFSTQDYPELEGYPRHYPVAFPLTSFALCDMTGDGSKELIIYSDFSVGLYYILHREGDSFYGVSATVRPFDELQENGVYIGSGGAGTNYYHKLHFEEGNFWVEMLGYTDYTDRYYYSIHGIKVSEAEFKPWLEELMVGEVAWHDARAIQ